jgi:beta-glucanase (GH16 family)
MRGKAIAAGLALAIGIVAFLTLATDDPGGCVIGTEQACFATDPPASTAGAVGPSGPIETAPGATAGSSPSPTETAIPSPTAPPVYTFRDEFNGTRLKSVWGRHWPGFGASTWLGSQVTVGDGVLTITARKSGSRWYSGLIDTVGTFTQEYGVFSARIRFDQGNGLWPAFWLAQPQNKAREVAEVDVMEVCAYDAGLHNGNDVTLLHHYVHKRDGSHAFALGVRGDNLADAWHVYSVERRADHISFYLDGVESARFTGGSEIAGIKTAIVLDLAVGGQFCAADASTPKVATMQVDWVRVSE